jgi:5'-3' exonuclease
MGIPFYFREVVQKNPKILTNLRSCDRLFLDFNSIIHTTSYQVVNKLLQEKQKTSPGALLPVDSTLLHRIMASIVAYTNMVAKACPPRSLLYISIDGVAPLAKISQQRRRRYLSAYRNDKINEFKAHHGYTASAWDSNCITPGTDFMRDLNAYLVNYYTNNRIGEFDVVVSGSDEQGEGEHKILKYIKDTQVPLVDVIYGLDADLIMLALTCNRANIHLMREAQQFGRSRDYTDVDFKFVDIDVMRTSIAKALFDERFEYMRDYVFICFVLGNDFLPHNPFLHLKQGALGQVFDIYKKLHGETKMFAIVDDAESNKATINFSFLKMLFHELARDEDTRALEAIKGHEAHQHFERGHPHQSALDRFVCDLEMYPLKNKPLESYKAITSEKNWRMQYYYNLMDINGFKDLHKVDDVCMEYVMGLVWNVNYYFNNTFDNRWFFKYTHAPTFKDLSMFMTKTCNNEVLDRFNGLESIDIASHEQLLLVLPKSSMMIIPSEYRDILENPVKGCTYMYPNKFKICTFLKSQLWECTPILPMVDVKKIKRAVGLTKI